MTVFFTSDPHLGHRLVAHLRGFGDSRETADTQAHDRQLAANWDAVVTDDDLVWVLGDLDMKNTPGAALAWVGARKGRKRLIFGNHDPGHPGRSRAHRYFADYSRVFEYVAPFARTRVCGHEVLLSHFPYDGPGSDRPDADGYVEARFTQYRLPDEGMWLLHGHTHGPERAHHGRQVHVGLDAWSLQPVDDASIAKLIEAGPIPYCRCVGLDHREDCPEWRLPF